MSLRALWFHEHDTGIYWGSTKVVAEDVHFCVKQPILYSQRGGIVSGADRVCLTIHQLIH